jgi:hypothetical protein
VMSSEPLVTRWLRRFVTVPLFMGLCPILLVLLPMLLPLAALLDAIWRNHFATVRCLLFFAFYLCCEVAGILASFALWLADRLTGGDRERFDRWNFVLQGWWATALFRGAAGIFGMHLVVAGEGDVGPGPILLFIRHASVGDTVLAAMFLSRGRGFALRYVLKRELLWDPCLDIVGNRLPNCFVRRGSGDSAAEVAAIQRLLDGLGPKQGVLIYPEGTRFTPAKRERALVRLSQAGEPQLVERARSLRHLLPPRLGGPLGLLANNPGADAVFCAHTGFEGAATFRDLLRGSLVGATVRVQFWRVPFSEIPSTASAQIDFLYRQWSRIDEWVGTSAHGGQTTDREPVIS